MYGETFWVNMYVEAMTPAGKQNQYNYQNYSNKNNINIVGNKSSLFTDDGKLYDSISNFTWKQGWQQVHSQ